MPLNNMSMYWNLPGQFNTGNYPGAPGQSFQGYTPPANWQGRYPGWGIPNAQNTAGGNPTWGAVGIQNAGGQGYSTPGYPPQCFNQQLPRYPMPMSQAFPAAGYQSSGYQSPGLQPPGFQAPGLQAPAYQSPSYQTPSYPVQGYAPQHNFGYAGQMPFQPAWEQPKQGGLKGFISNLMAKRKR